MDQITNLLFGSLTGQLTLAIVLFMLVMMGYLAAMFISKSKQDGSSQ